MKLHKLIPFIAALGILLTASGAEAATTFPVNGGTGSTSPSGILVGKGTAPVNTLLIGTGLSFNGTTLTNTVTNLVSSVFGRTGTVVATTGDYTTAMVTEVTNLYFTTARVLATTLTGFVSGSGTVSSSDTVLSAIDKLDGNIAGKQASGNYITALTGDVTASGPGSAAATLATVNSNVGSFTSANITVNAKGLITAASNGTAGGVTSVTASYPVISSGGATPSISLAFGTTTVNAWSALQTLNGGLTTAGTVTLGTLTGVLHAASGVVSAAAVDLTSEVTGILPVANGGTGAASFTAGNRLVVSHGTSAFTDIALPLTVSNGGTGATSFTAGQLIGGNGTGVLFGVATTTATCAGTVSCSTFNILGSSPVTITGSGSGGSISTSTALANGNIDFSTGINTIGNDSTFFWDNTNKRLGIGSSTPYAQLGINAPAGIAPYLAIGSSTGEVFSVKPSSTATLGIGTTSPGSPFSVGGITNFTTATSTFYGTGGINLAAGCFAVGGVCITGTGGTITGTTGQNVYISATNVASATSTIFTSTASNVGIGSTSPSQKLSVTGNSWVTGYTHTGTSSDTFAGGNPLTAAAAISEVVGQDNTTAGVSNVVQNSTSGANAYGDFVLYNDNPNSLANYGALIFQSSTYSSTAFGTAFSSPNQLALQNTVGPLTIAASGGSQYINFVAGGVNSTNEVARITSTGLGIGTTTPSAKLSVDASGTATQPGLSLASQGTPYLTGASSTAPGLLVGTTTSSINFATVAASTTAGTANNGYFGTISVIAGFENTVVKLFQVIDQWGHRITGGDAPAITSCGTTPSFIGAANDNDMTIQVGSVSATGCTATFAHAWPTAPTCTVTERTGSITNLLAYTVSATAVVVTQTGITGDILDMRCEDTQ